MTTAFDGDDWTPELEAEIRSAFDGIPFEMLDEIDSFSQWLGTTPDADK
jgi:hypothetical protein